jgi:amino acid permease
MLYCSIEEPTLNKWNRVTHLSVLFALVVMAIFAMGGYATFGNATEGNLTLRNCGQRPSQAKKLT